MRTRSIFVVLLATIAMLVSCSKGGRSYIRFTGPFSSGFVTLERETTVPIPFEASGDVVWTSSNWSVAAAVGGYLSTYAAGDAVITATCGKATAELNVTVLGALVTYFSIPLSLNLRVGEKSTVPVSGIAPETATVQDIIWSLDKTDIVSLSMADGGISVEALDDGEVVLTGTNRDGDFKASCKIICKSLDSFKLSKSAVVLTEDDGIRLEAIQSPADMFPVTWSSDKPSVATVSEDGVVSSVSSGIATITATAGKFTASCTVEVITGDVDAGIGIDAGWFNFLFSGSTWFGVDRTRDYILPVDPSKVYVCPLLTGLCSCSGWSPYPNLEFAAVTSNGVELPDEYSKECSWNQTGTTDFRLKADFWSPNRFVASNPYLYTLNGTSEISMTYNGKTSTFKARGGFNKVYLVEKNTVLDNSSSYSTDWNEITSADADMSSTGNLATLVVDLDEVQQNKGYFLLFCGDKEFGCTTPVSIMTSDNTIVARDGSAALVFKSTGNVTITVAANSKILFKLGVRVTRFRGH